MAIRNQYQDQFLEDQLPVLNALIMDEYEGVQNHVYDVFNVQSSTNWGEQTLTMAGIKAATVKDEGAPVEFDDPIEGYEKTYIPITYAIACSFSEELREDQRMNMVEKTYRSLGKAMSQTEQIVSWNVFNDGFTDTGPDGSSLFNTAHTMIGLHTFANRPTADIALSVAGLRAMEVSMMRQVNHRNISIALLPRKIIVPPELSQTATELLRSSTRPDTPNRSMNTFYPTNYDLYVIPFLTSETAWFATSEKTDHELRFIDRVQASVKSWEDEPTGDVNTRIRRRFDVSYSDFIGTWGTTG